MPEEEQPTKPLASHSPAEEKEGEPILAERIKLIGGLVAVGAGILAVTVIAIVAIALDSDEAGTIASAAAGVIASLVGAYFGVKIGSEGLKEQAAKAQAFAAHIEPDKADEILDKAQAFAEKATRR